MRTVEYRVRPVTRFIVTRYFRAGNAGGCETKGEFDRPSVADDVAKALAANEKNEAERSAKVTATVENGDVWQFDGSWKRISEGTETQS